MRFCPTKKKLVFYISSRKDIYNRRSAYENGSHVLFNIYLICIHLSSGRCWTRDKQRRKLAAKGKVDEENHKTDEGGDVIVIR